MPANLTPEYKRAERLFREAQGTEEKIAALELMLRTIPKHKGTDHMQADIKHRLAKLRAAPATKGGGRHTDMFHVPSNNEGTQVALLGTPNAGKSALLAALTNAPAQVAEFPFSTHRPVPGIMMHEDVPIQLVDMPPITREHVATGQINTYRHCDLIMVVVDLASAEVTEQVETCLAFLADRTLMVPEGADPDDQLYQHMAKPLLIVATKADLAQQGDFEALRQMYSRSLDWIVASVNEPGSLARLSLRIFEALRIVRVYSKLPGKEADMTAPFVLGADATVYDLARSIHRELADKLRYARIWGRVKHPGQQVHRDHVLHDKDIAELHFP